jgi:hypothetical protein
MRNAFNGVPSAACTSVNSGVPKTAASSRATSSALSMSTRMVRGSRPRMRASVHTGGRSIVEWLWMRYPKSGPNEAPYEPRDAVRTGRISGVRSRRSTESSDRVSGLP